MKQSGYGASVDHVRDMLERGRRAYGEAYWDVEEEFLRKWLAAHAQNSALTVGCGLMREAEVLYEGVCGRVFGLDLHREYLAAALHRLDGPQLDRTRLLRADAHALPFLDQAVDLVLLLYHGLGNMKDPRRAAAEALRVAGRSALFSVWSADQETIALRYRYYLGVDPNRRVVRRSVEEGLDILSVEVTDGHIVFETMLFADQWLMNLFAEFKGFDAKANRRGMVTIWELNRRGAAETSPRLPYACPVCLRELQQLGMSRSITCVFCAIEFGQDGEILDLAQSRTKAST